MSNVKSKNNNTKTIFLHKTEKFKHFPWPMYSRQYPKTFKALIFCPRQFTNFQGLEGLVGEPLWEGLWFSGRLVSVVITAESPVLASVSPRDIDSPDAAKIIIFHSDLTDIFGYSVSAPRGLREGQKNNHLQCVTRRAVPIRPNV